MIIAVASGKGGTGKTLVATNLALSLKGETPVRLLDCDVEEPNCHIFLKPELAGSEPVAIKVPEVDASRCNGCGTCAEVCAYKALAVVKEKVLVFAQLCHGCGACSYLCPTGAISETDREVGIIESGPADGIDFYHGKLNIGEAMAVPLIRRLKQLTRFEGNVVIDVPPGTSCPVVEAVADSDFCLLVTEPTPFGLNDLKLAVETVRKLGVPMGVVLNRTGVGDKETEAYLAGEKIPIMMTIPLDREIARLYSDGVALVTGNPQWQNRFKALFGRIREQVS